MLRQGLRETGLPIADGTLEALKWVALLAMTADHVDKYLLNSTVGTLFDVGRLAMPLFAVVLGVNLARKNKAQRSQERIMLRLAVTGIVATPVFVALGGVWHGWPGNIMFSLLAIAATTNFLAKATRRGYAEGLLVFLVGGAVVEFWWPGIALGVGAWWYCRRPGTGALVALGGLFGVCAINGNGWALLAVPILAAAARIDIPVPRLRWMFYFYYPLHLAALWLLRIPMRKAGYLFF